MDNEKIEVNGRTLEKKYLEKAIKICEEILWNLIICV